MLSCRSTKALYDYRKTAGDVRENYGRVENEESGVAEDVEQSSKSTDKAKEEAESEGSLIERLKKLLDEIRDGDSEQHQRANSPKRKAKKYNYETKMGTGVS